MAHSHVDREAHALVDLQRQAKDWRRGAPYALRGVAGATLLDGRDGVGHG